MSLTDERCALSEQRLLALRGQKARLDRRENHISIFRLATFLGGAIAITTGVTQGSATFLLLGGALAVLFFVGVVAHARLSAKQREVDVRIGVHARHLSRIRGPFDQWPGNPRELLPADHAYARDIDLVGEGSLFDRIDVTQTREGELALARALAEPASAETIAARQTAVEELASKHAYREELETLGTLPQKAGEKLDHRPFLALVSRPSLFAARPWLRPVMFVLPAITLSCVLLATRDLLPSSAPWACVFAQALLLWRLREPVHETLDVITARIGFAKAYEGLLRLLESESFQAPALRALQSSLALDGQPPSVHMRRLSRYEGFAQLRTQGPVYLVLNLVTLWDLFCLERIERFVARVGPRCEAWFIAVGELEMLCSLATLRHADPYTCFPEIGAPEHGLTVEQLAHPLLPPETRVANDLSLAGPGSALIVTGSNMAGKSTLLRALGLNVALALAGGPVCARHMRLPVVRLRASIRIDDSLQRGASYFHAELMRLRLVIRQLDQGPPVLFVLDELLRGTNAHARHQGARAVVLHLLRAGAMGVVATHDIALSELEDELPAQVKNAHFTDVFEAGEMRFDYKLRQGVVQSSNALRLLNMAGIDVAVDTAVQ